MISAFGVDHGNISKASRHKVIRYGAEAGNAFKHDMAHTNSTAKTHFTGHGSNEDFFSATHVRPGSRFLKEKTTRTSGSYKTKMAGDKTPSGGSITTSKYGGGLTRNAKIGVAAGGGAAAGGGGFGGYKAYKKKRNRD